MLDDCSKDLDKKVSSAPTGSSHMAEQASSEGGSEEDMPADLKEMQKMMQDMLKGLN
jgi:hypothetical protein